MDHTGHTRVQRPPSPGAALDADYVCTLDQESLEVARRELNERAEDRMLAVQALRSWLRQQPHIHCKEDTRYLLRFLRYGKFSQLRARSCLQAYLHLQTMHRSWCSDLDPADKRIQAFLACGYVLPLPGRDTKGRKVLLIRSGAFDPSSKEYDKWNVMAGMRMVMVHEQMEENAQVNGFVFIQDFSDFSMKHKTYYSPGDMKQMASGTNGSVPMRIKALHFYNTGAVFETILSIFIPMIGKKFKDRIFKHGYQLERLYEQVPMSMLPSEYLPDDYTGPSPGSCADLANDLRRRLTLPDTRAALIDEMASRWGLDDTAKTPTDPEQNSSYRRIATE